MGGRFSLMSVSVVTPLRCVKKEERLLNILRCKNKKMQPCARLLLEPPPVCPSGYRRMGLSKLPGSKAGICVGAEVRPFPRRGHTCHGTITGFERTYAALSMDFSPQGLVLLFRQRNAESLSFLKSEPPRALWWSRDLPPPYVHK